jgi:hypothetical protein
MNIVALEGIAYSFFESIGYGITEHEDQRREKNSEEFVWTSLENAVPVC